MKEVERKMIDIFRASLSLETDDPGILAHTRPQCSKWDSMGHLNLILAAEDVFQVSIPEEQGAQIASFAEMEAMVRRLKKIS